MIPTQRPRCILARQSFEEIALANSTLAAAVDYYEALFFNVRDRIDARSWVFDNILVPAIVAEYGDRAISRGLNWGTVRPFYDATLKLFAYFGGRHAVELLVYGGFSTFGMPQTANDTAKFLDDVWASAIRGRSTRAMLLQQVGFANVAPLFQLHAQLISAAKAQRGHDGGNAALTEITAALLAATPFATGSIAEAPRQPIDDGPCEARGQEKVLAGVGRPVNLPTADPRPLDLGVRIRPGVR